MGGDALDLDDLDAALDGLSTSQSPPIAVDEEANAAPVHQAPVPPPPSSQRRAGPVEVGPPGAGGLDVDFGDDAIDVGDVELPELEAGDDDGLGEVLESPTDAPPKPSTTPPALSAQGFAPPPRRRKSDGPLPTASLQSDWTGRTAFEDLFVPDNAPLPSSRGGLEEKVEYFREKLKRSEAMTARFRDAWHLREGEMDVLEAVMQREKARGDDLNTRLDDLQQRYTALERFLEQKKVEFEAYGQKVNEAFAQRESLEAQLRRDIDTARAEGDAKVADKEAERRGVQNQLEFVQGELEQERSNHANDNQANSEAIAARDTTIAQLESRVSDLAHELEVARQELLESRDAFERDLAIRTEAIEKLKASLEKQREAILERDEQIDNLSAQVARLEDEASQNRVAYEGQVAALNQELESQRAQFDSDTNQRDEVIAKLKDAVERQREAIAQRDDTIAAHEAEIEQRGQLLAQRDEELAQLRSDFDAKQGELVSLQEQSAHDLDVRASAIERLKEAVQTQKEAIAQRDQQIDDLHGQVAQRQDDIAEREAQLQRSHEQLDEMTRRYEATQNELRDAEASAAESIDELKHGVAVRDDAIERLKGAVENAKARILEGDSALEEAREQMAQLRATFEEERQRSGEILGRTRKALEVAQKLLA